MHEVVHRRRHRQPGELAECRLDVQPRHHAASPSPARWHPIVEHDEFEECAIHERRALKAGIARVADQRYGCADSRSPTAVLPRAC